jgi:hypothetical protein
LRVFRARVSRNLNRWKHQIRGPIAAEFCALIESSATTVRK